eukprot:1181402-Prorocentrum_minimum.AAC.3
MKSRFQCAWMHLHFLHFKTFQRGLETRGTPCRTRVGQPGHPVWDPVTGWGIRLGLTRGAYVHAERSPLFCANLWGDLHEFSDLLIATFGTDLGNRRNNVVWGHSRHWPPITAKLSFSRLCGRMWGIFGDDC